LMLLSDCFFAVVIGVLSNRRLALFCWYQQLIDQPEALRPA
jgi:hypothetical protein